MNDPDISIIIVNWNTRDCLLDCLRSIYSNGTHYTQEIILVDNASCDGSTDAVEREFPGVRLIKNSVNFGFARANNQGIGASKGRYIALINSDVLLLPVCLDRLVSFMDKHPGVGIVGPRVLNPDGSLQPSCKRLPTLRLDLAQAIGLHLISSRFSSDYERAYHESMRYVEALTGCFLIVRRAATDRVGGFDEKFFMYNEEVDWCRRFSLAGWKLVYYPCAEAIHLGGASSANEPTRFYVEYQKSKLYYYHKHYGYGATLGLRLILFLRAVLRLGLSPVAFFLLTSRRPTIMSEIKHGIASLLWLLRIRRLRSDRSPHSEQSGTESVGVSSWTLPKLESKKGRGP